MARSPCCWSWPVKLSSSRGVMLLPVLALCVTRRQTLGDTCSAASGWMLGSVPSSVPSWWGWAGSSPCWWSPLRRELRCAPKVSLPAALAFLKPAVLGCDSSTVVNRTLSQKCCSLKQKVCFRSFNEFNEPVNLKGSPLTNVSPGWSLYKEYCFSPCLVQDPHTTVPAKRCQGFFLHSIWFVLSPSKACFADASSLGFFVQNLSWRCFGSWLNSDQFFSSCFFFFFF